MSASLLCSHTPDSKPGVELNEQRVGPFRREVFQEIDIHHSVTWHWMTETAEPLPAQEEHGFAQRDLPDQRHATPPNGARAFRTRGSKALSGLPIDRDGRLPRARREPERVVQPERAVHERTKAKERWPRSSGRRSRTRRGRRREDGQGVLDRGGDVGRGARPIAASPQGTTAEGSPTFCQVSTSHLCLPLTYPPNRQGVGPCRRTHVVMSSSLPRPLLPSSPPS